MHSIFFGLRRYCSSYHQWHFSPRNLCFVYFKQLQKGPYLPGAKRNERKSSFFFVGAEGYENHLLFYFWTDFHIHGHLREVRLLRPTSSQGERHSWWQGHKPEHKSCSILADTHTTHCPPWHHRDSLQGKEKRIAIKKKKITKKFPHFFLAFFFFVFKACNSRLCPGVN